MLTLLGGATTSGLNGNDAAYPFLPPNRGEKLMV